MCSLRALLLSTVASAALLANVNARADEDHGRRHDHDAGPVVITYVPNSLSEATVADGPWNLHQQAGRNPHDASGILPAIKTPFNPPTTAYGTPYEGYCVGGRVQVAQGVNPMQPYYFPFVRGKGDDLEGFFDYRPRNEQEATVAAISHDWGKSWIFKDEVLGLNPYCPADPTDPDNNNVIVNGLKTAYGSDSTSAADNGLGHAFVITIDDDQLIYHLNRAAGHIDHDPLVVHALRPKGTHTLASLPNLGYVSPIGSMGYPTLDVSAEATVGLESPDAILGSVDIDGLTTIVYVEKQLGGATGTPVLTPAQTCPLTPNWALTNIVTGKARKPNNDVITIRVATTRDGINFTDVGAAKGLQEPTSTAFNAIRWLGSGSVIRLSNGHYGMFFGAGNCLDNDSDGFHVLGYAETANEVDSPTDLLNWKVIYGFDNPILSTDTVTNPTIPPVTYPANPPLVNVTGADALTAAQVSPWVHPAGHDTNFFSGRVYDPQAIYTDSSTVTIVFAGYNTPQPSSNLGDYRTIGRFQVRFPVGYVAPPRSHFDRD